jgi:hypothetical protein
MDAERLPTAHLKLVTRLKEELRSEMEGIVERRVDVKGVKAWLRAKGRYFYTILTREKIEPATNTYKIIKQIGDVPIHFVAAYRIASKEEQR